MSIESKAISALKWATMAKLVVQLTSWAGTLIIIRLLTPDDYGLMAKVSVVCAIAGAIAEFGLGAAIVRWSEISRDELQKIYGISLLFSLIITLALAASAPGLAVLFREPRLTWPIAVTSLNIIISTVAMVPSSLATRNLEFGPLSKIEMKSGVLTIVTTLILALVDAGVWALVLGTLAGALARSIALLVFYGHIRPRFSFAGISEHLKFGVTLMWNRVSYFVVFQSDVLIGSAFLTTKEIGQYSVALQLATLPMSKVMGTINQIALPAIARQQNDLGRVRQTVLKSIGLISLIAFPMLCGISAVAPELVRVLLGEQWLPAVTALVLLPLVVPIRMIGGVLFTTALALGNRQVDLRNTMVFSALLPLGFFVGSHWGLNGLCVSWLVTVPLAYSITVRSVTRSIGIRVRDLARECGIPVLATIVMYAAVAAARIALPDLSSWLELIMLTGVGALTYFGLVAVLSKRHLHIAQAFVRSMTGKGDTTPPLPSDAGAR
jgi:O-antigen/teichoic acid export membrane protein